MAKTTRYLVTPTVSPKKMQGKADCSPATLCSVSTGGSEAKEAQRSLLDELTVADGSEYSDIDCAQEVLNTARRWHSEHNETEAQDEATTDAAQQTIVMSSETKELLEAWRRPQDEECAVLKTALCAQPTTQCSYAFPSIDSTLQIHKSPCDYCVPSKPLMRYKFRTLHEGCSLLRSLSPNEGKDDKDPSPLLSVRSTHLDEYSIDKHVDERKHIGCSDQSCASMSTALSLRSQGCHSAKRVSHSSSSELSTTSVRETTPKQFIDGRIQERKLMPHGRHSGIEAQGFWEEGARYDIARVRQYS